jgi:XapX domain-containing protein
LISENKPNQVLGIQRRSLVKVLAISFAVGLFVGVLYGVIRVKSPAPPIIALLGLLGMVLGEQLGGWVIAKKVNVTHAAAVCLVGKRWDQQPSAQSLMPTQHHED